VNPTSASTRPARRREGFVRRNTLVLTRSAIFARLAGSPELHGGQRRRRRRAARYASVANRPDTPWTIDRPPLGLTGQRTIGHISRRPDAARRARRRAEIDGRSTMSPPGPAPDRLRVATCNLNSLRARHLGANESSPAPALTWCPPEDRDRLRPWRWCITVAATDSDVLHPDAFAGSTRVTTAGRAALERLLSTGLVDVDVARWGRPARHDMDRRHRSERGTAIGPRRAARRFHPR
jgi:hypothetical protein